MNKIEFLISINQSSVKLKCSSSDHCGKSRSDQHHIENWLVMYTVTLFSNFIFHSLCLCMHGYITSRTDREETSSSTKKTSQLNIHIKHGLFLSERMIWNQEGKIKKRTDERTKYEKKNQHNTQAHTFITTREKSNETLKIN